MSSITHQTVRDFDRKAVAAAVAGNALEFYDFVIYAFFAVYIGQTFFPVGSEGGSLLASLATFGVGFFMRPLGGFLIGSFADSHGRKPAMILTVSLITVGTIGLALTPSYAQIGVAAPIVVVVCRLLQGLALGGEVGPATAMLYEAAPEDRRGLYTSWQIASQGLAAVVAGAFGVILSALLDKQDLATWGWRVPFIVSLALIPIAVYLRRNLPETLERKATHTGLNVMGELFRNHSRLVFLCVLVLMSGTVSVQLGNYMTSYALVTLKLPPVIVQANVFASGLVMFGAALLGGHLTDLKGRKVVMIAPRALTLILVVPSFVLLNKFPSIFSLLVTSSVLGALTAMSLSAVMVLLPEQLPNSCRSSGLAIAYAVGATLFGGSAQFIFAWLQLKFGDPLMPAYYVVIASAVSLVAMAVLPESRKPNRVIRPGPLSVGS